MKKESMNVEKGFTLIELMIVVAITGALSIIAIPSYRGYVIRTEVSEGMSLISSAKEAVAESLQESDSFCGTNEKCGVPADIVGSFVSSIAIGKGGVITATFGTNANNQLRDKTLAHTPTNTGGSVLWKCSGTMAQQYLPRGCEDLVTEEVKANLPTQTFATYKPPEEVCTNDDQSIYDNAEYMSGNWEGGLWILVGSDGRPVKINGKTGHGRHKFFNCDHVRRYTKTIMRGSHGIKGHVNHGGEHFCIVEEQCDTPEIGERADPALYRLDRTYPRAKYVYAHPNTRGYYSEYPDVRQKYQRNPGESNYFKYYNFETGVWSNDQGGKFKNGIRVE